MKPRLCFVVAIPLTARVFLSGHITALAKEFDIDLVADTDDEKELGAAGLHSRLRSVAIRRQIAPLADLRALWRLFRLFHTERYAVISSVTPKAGLLSLLAGTLAGVPVRIHMFTGQVWATKRGWKRRLLKTIDQCMARLATHILTDGPAQRDFLIAEGIVAADRIRVLGPGSSCGVDGDRFKPSAQHRTDVRACHGIPEDAVVFLYLGRLNRDKGVLDLVAAFAQLGMSKAWLLIVGPDEAGMRAQMEVRLGTALARTRFVGYTDRPEDYMAAADVFCLPSYREGFNTGVIEAAACGLPVIASRIYGIADAMVEGQTGLLHLPRDVAAIRIAIEGLIADATYREALGRQGREHVLTLYSAEAITGAWQAYYGQFARLK